MSALTQSATKGGGGRDHEPAYTIGDLAREFGVSLRALRFYEDRGLLQPQRRGLSRLYDAADRLRLQMILKGKQLGFTLPEIGEMVGAGADEDFAATLKPEQVLAQISHLERQRVDLDGAIEELRATHARLSGRAVPLDKASNAA